MGSPQTPTNQAQQAPNQNDGTDAPGMGTPHNPTVAGEEFSPSEWLNIPRTPAIEGEVYNLVLNK